MWWSSSGREILKSPQGVRYKTYETYFLSHALPDGGQPGHPDPAALASLRGVKQGMQ